MNSGIGGVTSPLPSIHAVNGEVTLWKGHLA